MNNKFNDCLQNMANPFAISKLNRHFHVDELTAHYQVSVVSQEGIAAYGANQYDKYSINNK